MSKHPVHHAPAHHAEPDKHVAAKVKADVADHERMAVEKANRQAAEAPAAEGGLLALLEGLGDAKSGAMHAIHMRLVEMRAFIDEAIAGAEGDLKKFLEALRGFLA